MRTVQASTELNQDHLDRVSRSFAFCIARLRGDFKFYVGHSYLMLRVLDTVEDAPWPSADLQKNSLREFNSFLEEPPSAESLGRWQSELEALSLPKGEALLIADTARLFDDFHNLLEPQVRETLKRCTLNMSRGMEYYLSMDGPQALRLNSISEVNRYCFFVAGVVGELLHEVFLAVRASRGEPISQDKERSLEGALHLGLFLQKVNILKDQQTDEREDRLLVPSREQVLASLGENARRGFEYILNLPYEAEDYRVFCSWSLFLGLASLPWIEESWRNQTAIKIPRWRTKLLLDEVERKINSNDDLRELFEKYVFEAELISNTDSTLPTMGFPEFSNLYSGHLSQGQLKSLGLI